MNFFRPILFIPFLVFGFDVVMVYNDDDNGSGSNASASVDGGVVVMFETRNAHFSCLFVPDWCSIHLDSIRPQGDNNNDDDEDADETKQANKLQNYAVHRNVNDWATLQYGVICIQCTDTHIALPHTHMFLQIILHFGTHWIMSMPIFYLPILHLWVSLQLLPLHFFYLFEPGKVANYPKKAQCLIEKRAIGMSNIDTHKQTNKSVKMASTKNVDEWLAIWLNLLPSHFP